MNIINGIRYILQENFKCVYLSLFIITKLFLESEYLLLFKLNQLMVPIGGKTRPRRPRIQFKNFPCKMSLCLPNIVRENIICKMQIIMGLSNYSFFQYCGIIILKLALFLCFIFGIISLLPSFISLNIVRERQLLL